MDNKRIIAVVTDFGADSFFVGVMKGALLHAAPACPIVDITHSIPPFDVAQGSFVLDTAFDFLPTGAVFLAVVDPGVGGTRRNLIFEAGDRYVVGPDNGLVTDVATRVSPIRQYVIDDSKLDRFRARAPVGRTFLGRDVFAPAAAALATGVAPTELGTPSDEAPAAIDIPRVRVEPSFTSAKARYVDSFGNILTAITKRHLKAAFGETDLGGVCATIDGHDLGKLCRYYDERPTGSLMAVLNSWDRVEISECGRRAIDRFAGRKVEDLTVELRPSRA